MSDSADRATELDMRQDQAPVVLYTIGHGNARPSDLIELLREYEIGLLIDVRSTPYSRYAFGFNREQFRDTLLRAGIDYRYAGDLLGGHPSDPALYLSGQVPSGDADYLQLVDYPAMALRPQFQKGLRRLIEIASSRRSAVMCSEEDPIRCHRHHLIARSAIASGLVVRHLRYSRGQPRIQNAEQLKSRLPSTEAEHADQLPLF